MQSAISVLRNLPNEVRLERLEALVYASETLNKAQDLDEILHSILDLVQEQLDCERATVFLLDQRTNKLHARQMIGSEPIEIILDRGIGIAGSVFETSESVVINDVQSDQRFDRETDLRTGFHTRTMLCVPLKKVGGETIGVLQAINSRKGSFTETCLAYLESFASVAAVAVEREQLVQNSLRVKLLSTELELARKIQQRLLPPQGKMKLQEPFSAWGLSQSCYDVGGDAYDAIVLPSGECVFWVADVSGKGIGAALLMNSLQTELRALVHAERDLSILAKALNERINEVAPIGTYATLFLGAINPKENHLSYVNAGHVSPVWLNEQTKEERKFKPCGLPIGLMPAAEYEVRETTFSNGERLAVFSDGVTDAVNTDEENFEENGLAESFKEITAKDVEGIGTEFFEILDRFRMGASPTDDTTFLVVGLD